MKENDDVDGEPIEAEDKVEEEAVPRPRKTSKFMTKYERARILGTRALQIRFGFRLSDYIELLTFGFLCLLFLGVDTA